MGTGWRINLASGAAYAGFADPAVWFLIMFAPMLLLLRAERGAAASAAGGGR